jgi:N-acetylglucosamine malate deacetylase 1
MTDQTVLVVAAHPDDEFLGCGGTVARHATNGDSVKTLILAEGSTSRSLERDPDDADIALLIKAATAAAKTLGVSAPQFAKLPDNRMDGLELLDIVKQIEEVIKKLKPTIVYTHHGGDLNIDHRITHQAVMTACRPIPDSTIHSIYAFETPSSTEWASTAIGETFSPTRFVDISSHLAAKLDALNCYKTEMRAFPHARSLKALEALAILRGSQVGVPAAEAFQVLFSLVKMDQ